MQCIPPPSPPATPPCGPGLLLMGLDMGLKFRMIMHWSKDFSGLIFVTAEY
jgi:hypothetical protein